MLNFFVGKIKICSEIFEKKSVLLYPISILPSPTTKLVQFLLRIHRKNALSLVRNYDFPKENYRYFLGHVCLAKSPPRSPFAFCWDMVFCQEQQLFMKYRICVSSVVHNKLKSAKKWNLEKPQTILISIAGNQYF